MNAPQKILITLSVNGREHQLAVRPAATLLDVLRDELGLTGSHRGCDMGTCGCCTVHIDGRPWLACLTLAAEVEGERSPPSRGCTEQRSYIPCRKPS